ncbi:hypothetical protein M8J77_021188 [Diaphorina citri]|nr:hypothetical protein M8J77_021188 [Diaphorina citri]
METHNMTFSLIKENNRTFLILENEKFIYNVPQSDGSLLYKCIVEKCTAKVKIDKKTKSKIVGGHFVHANHPAPKPSIKKTNDNGQQTPNRKSIKPTSHVNSQPNKKSIGSPNQANPVTTPKKSVNHTNHMSTQTSPTTISVSPDDLDETFSDCCSENSKKLQKALAQIEELKLLRDSLIEKIMEKERTIIQLEENNERHKTNSDDKRNSDKSKDGENKKFDRNYSSKRTPNIRSSNTKCHLIGDSHVRALSQHLREDHDENVDALCKPGAGFEAIQETPPINTQSNSKDHIVIFCGTNDVQSNDWSKVKQAISNIINKYKTHHLSFILVPVRWDRPYVNTRVAQFNAMLRNFFKDKNISYLDPNFYLRPWHYAKDGIHMNRKGKRLICLKIKTQLLDRVYEAESRPVALNLGANVSSTPQIPSTSTNIYSDVSMILPSNNQFCNVDNSVWSPMHITTIMTNRNDSFRTPNFYSDHVLTKRI